MERSCYGGRGGSSRDVQQQWMSYHHHHESLLWPPRSYTCSFCKREFRSAQALGGHMNVHRRDRARLRQSPPWDPPPPFCPNPNPNPNPNASHARVPNLNLSPPPPSSGAAGEAKHPSPVLYAFTSLLSPVPSPTARPVCPFRSSAKAAFAGEGLQAGRAGEEKKMARIEIVGSGIEEDLDLELRLGYT